ncbi:MAG: NADPH-dependent 7-cyano-7-deazaguanine reductase QueF [Gammaproteobacteria bacterium RIFCSPHIGHO2_12_FULL_41_20]|nr:MAG: NADPH-dependent 7-cyano-7-deazaguanine reductase QueF [Gammaproteobacteria bacterium RIFCSPHIGHO2_12_FULL_41_20]
MPSDETLFGSVDNLNCQQILHSPLGKKNEYISHYQPDLLFPIERQAQRQQLGITANALPFQGNDVWNAYELSWLNTQGKPMIAMAEFIFPCTSSHLIESKSFKLYLNSFNNTQFDSMEAVQAILVRDLTKATGTAVFVQIQTLANVCMELQRSFSGICLDELAVTCDTYSVTPAYLQTENQLVTESLYSDLLKSNCPVTGQPDWASVQIAYTGKQIQHAGLLKYIVSYRNHQEFHEQCVETIFCDIQRYCQPEKLCVFARYMRRGGLDINPYRANYPVKLVNQRLWRQ